MLLLILSLLSFSITLSTSTLSLKLGWEEWAFRCLCLLHATNVTSRTNYLSGSLGYIWRFCDFPNFHLLWLITPIDISILNEHGISSLDYSRIMVRVVKILTLAFVRETKNPLTILESNLFSCGLYNCTLAS